MMIWDLLESIHNVVPHTDSSSSRPYGCVKIKDNSVDSTNAYRVKLGKFKESTITKSETDAGKFESNHR